MILVRCNTNGAMEVKMLRDTRLHIRLPRSIKRMAEKRAKVLGFSLSEYIRLLIIMTDSMDILWKRP
jgi:hypothetical protein